MNRAMVPPLYQPLGRSMLRAMVPSLYQPLGRSMLRAMVPSLYQPLGRSVLRAMVPPLYQPLGRFMLHHDMLGFRFPALLLPGPQVDLTRWAVIACDQFTSEPAYWEEVEQRVANSPSTLRMILPEAFLGTPREEAWIRQSHATMREYLTGGILREMPGPIYVERTTAGRTRKGLMLCLDLTQYDFSPGSQSLVRATEGTIVERLPPRVRIREGAPLELPHILVLIDDPGRTVIEPIAEQKAALPRLYDFDLMLGGGHLAGYSAASQPIQASIQTALSALADREAFERKYAAGPDKGVLLFAVGDGNHSLATAKTIWERAKNKVGLDHPLRYALVEVENVHDPALVFEPIHRVVFGLRHGLVDALRSLAGGALEYRPCEDERAMIRAVNEHRAGEQIVGVIEPDRLGIARLSSPSSSLAVGTLERLLDRARTDGLFEKLDYVHGDETVCLLGRKQGQAGMYLPSLQKADLFKTVIHDGALPRKTFSMGHAVEKRFYLECRRIE